MMASKEKYPSCVSLKNVLCEPVTVSQRVGALYASTKFSDLTIYFQEKRDKIHAHRLILAMSSPVFESKLYGNAAVGPELHLPEDSFEAFQWLMEYMYCDNSQFSTTAIALEVSHLASKYQMDALKSLCSEYLQRVLNDVNYLKVYNAAVQLNNTDLIYKCSQIMQGSSGDVFSSQQITQLSRWALKHLLQQPCSIVTEVTVFRAVVTWGKHQLGARKANFSPCDLRQEIEEFLAFVRFLTMSTDEFVEHVVPTEVFTAEEVCSILRNIKYGKSIPLPLVCSNSREKRNVSGSF
ncbi:BTB/POZ domain-containing protein 6-like [Panulirus ornatus]|uniref:BTB/POZ domain-containing protein 6-like n=1 Tax=Panulirus ornatus TaxID=150431 RepID=UPI003A83BB68